MRAKCGIRSKRKADARTPQPARTADKTVYVCMVPSTKSLELAFHTVMLSCVVLSSAFVAPLLEPRAARFETKATGSAIHMAIGRREAAISLVSGAALAANVLPKRHGLLTLRPH